MYGNFTLYRSSSFKQGVHVQFKHFTLKPSKVDKVPVYYQYSLVQQIFACTWSSIIVWFYVLHDAHL